MIDIAQGTQVIYYSESNLPEVPVSGLADWDSALVWLLTASGSLEPTAVSPESTNTITF